MKKLKRIAVGQLGELQKISQKEQGIYVGGYGGDGNCFFNCLEYLNNKYGCHEGWTYEDYADDYITGYGNPDDNWNGTFLGSYDEGKDKGPLFLAIDDNNHASLNNEPFSYLANCFNTEGSQWTTLDNVGELFSSSLGNNSGFSNCTIVGAYIVGSIENGVTHCVIFTDYDSSSNMYSYFDPTTGSTGTVHSSRVLCGAKVNGCK